MTITTTRNDDDSCTATHTELDDDGDELWTVEAHARGSDLYEINEREARRKMVPKIFAERFSRGVQGAMGHG